MANGVAKYSQFRGSTHFTLKEPVLRHASFVTIRKGDLTTQFSRLAEHLTRDMPGTDLEIQIEKTTHDGNQRITVRRITPGAQAFSPEDLEKFRQYMDEFLAVNPVLDEEELLNWADTDKEATFEENSAEYLADEYIKNNFMPERKISTATEDNPGGHKIDVKLVRFYNEADGSLKFGITLGKDCKSCTASFLTTLRILNDSLGDYMMNLAGPENNHKLSGIRVLPNRYGSPSLRFDATPKRLSLIHL